MDYVEMLIAFTWPNQKRIEYYNIKRTEASSEEPKIDQDFIKSLENNGTKKVYETKKDFKNLNEYPVVVQVKMKSLLKSALKNNDIKESEQNLKHPNKKPFFLFENGFYLKAAKILRKYLDPLLLEKYQDKKVQFDTAKDGTSDRDSERYVPENTDQYEEDLTLIDEGEKTAIRKSSRLCKNK
jgi:hypothetical protein